MAAVGVAPQQTLAGRPCFMCAVSVRVCCKVGCCCFAVLLCGVALRRCSASVPAADRSRALSQTGLSVSKPFPEREEDEESVGMRVLISRSKDRQPEKKPKEGEEEEKKRPKATG